MTPPPPVRVALVDDDPLARMAVARILGRDEEFEVVGEASDGDEVVPLVRQVRPHVILMDLRMQRVGGVAAIQLLQREVDPPKVIALTAFNEDHYVLGALDAGAAGFLLKGSLPEDFRRAIRIALAGDAHIDPKSTRHLISRMAPVAAGPHPDPQRALRQLSDRELDIARMIWESKSNPEIARELYLGETTVKTHVSRLMAKLDCTTRVQVALLVERAGGLP